MSGSWKTVAVKKQWSVEGGYLSKAVTLETKEVDSLSGDLSFVKIDKNADWLLKAALGKNGGRGGLKRTQLFETIKKELTDAASGPHSRARSAGALGDSPPTTGTDDLQDAAVVATGCDDPMNELESIEIKMAAEPKKRKLYTSTRNKDNVTQITMPELEPTSHPNAKATRTVTLLATSTNSTWLLIDDVPWLVKWLSDEARSGGVQVASDDPLDALACNCEAAQVHIRWDFAGAWEAIVLAGEKKGVKVKSCVAKFTAEKWLAVHGLKMYGCAFENATPEQLKTATFQFLERHMQEVLESARGGE